MGQEMLYNDEHIGVMEFGNNETWWALIPIRLQLFNRFLFLYALVFKHVIRCYDMNANFLKVYH